MSYVPFRAPAATKATQKWPRPASTPVTKGPPLCERILRIFTTPITAVRSSGSTTMDRNAVRGAWSMLFRIARPISRQMVRGNFGGTGSRARKIELGRCVATMAWMRPSRLATDAANTFPMVDKHLFLH